MYFEKVHIYFKNWNYIQPSSDVIHWILLSLLPFIFFFFWPVSIFQFVYSEHTMNKPTLVV